ncbi:MAG: DNA repair protein RecN [Elusimicrobiota bacterium]
MKTRKGILLETLKIENFALLESAFLEIGPGFNVISGQTGAGKSILIGALSMVLGEWVGKEIVRKDADACEVEAVFSGEIEEDIAEFLEKKDLCTEMLILRRKFYAKGMSKCYINDRRVTLSSLSELGNLLIDIHSQNDHQALLKKKNQMKILDRFAGNEESVCNVRKEWGRLLDLKKKKEEKTIFMENTQKEIERLKYEIEEIDAACLRSGIEEEIEQDFLILSNADMLDSGIKELTGMLYEDDDAVVERLSSASKKLDELCHVDGRFGNFRETIEKAVCEIESVCENLRSYRAGSEFDSGRLEEVLIQKNRLSDLKRKYGQEIDSVLEYRDKIAKQISEYDDFTGKIQEVDSDISVSRKKLEKLNSVLSAGRKNGAQKLSQAVKEELGFLGMEGAQFTIRLDPAEQGYSGKETVEFLIKTNPGQSEMELAKIASGGEISRVMLALKSVLAGNDNIPLLVFDEIDAGIGATVAGNVGKEIKNLSCFHQVIVITHLPQIAGCADVHIKVSKQTSNGVTRTVIERLEENARVKEIERMFGGKEGAGFEEQARRILSNS